jgi:hypothetical protein
MQRTQYEIFMWSQVASWVKSHEMIEKNQSPARGEGAL